MHDPDFDDVPPPRGLASVLAPQQSGFFLALEGRRGNPVVQPQEVPPIFTFEPWLGCRWGRSCRFCYVPDASVRHYPGGKASPYYSRWGDWLLPKKDIARRLARELDLVKRPGAATYVYMSNRTDPFLPLPETRAIILEVLDVFADRDVFLMCQTRSPDVLRNGEVHRRLVSMAGRGRLAVSFSVSTDRLEEQRRIERSGLKPRDRLELMGALKSAGVFVSAAVSPLMPHSEGFAESLLECAGHASIQLAKGSGSGARTPSEVLEEVRRLPGYDGLADALADRLTALDPSFPWGIEGVGFVGAFLAARRFYG